MRVFVTGSSSHLAAALLPRLCAHADVEHVTGVDLKPSRFEHAKFHAHRADIRDPALGRLLHGHDALVHLAFVVLRGRMDERKMYDINVTGSREVFQAARRSGLRRLVHLSSAAVYGSGIHLPEEAAFNPLPRFVYARHKARLEEMLASEFPECVRLRPHAIVGRHAQPLLKRLLDQPCYPRTAKPYPLLQCVHEDDVADAVLLALQSDVHGPFNLAVADSFNFRDVIRRRHRISVPMPGIVARTGLELAWRLFGWGGEPAWIEGLSRTLLIDCSRATAQLGWRSSHDAASALASMSRMRIARTV